MILAQTPSLPADKELYRALPKRAARGFASASLGSQPHQD